jgi:uncharacterized protein
MVHSTARVRTDRPHRYAKQLAAHLGRRLATSWDEDTGSGSVRFPDRNGSASLLAQPGALVLELDSDTAHIETLEDVLGRHLARFGTKDELIVEWRRDDGTPGTVQRGGGDAPDPPGEHR